MSTAELQARYRLHSRLEIEDADAVFRNVATLPGGNRHVGGDISDSVDALAATATFRIARDGAQSLSPWIEGSALNRNLADEFAPLLDMGREVRYAQAPTLPAASPGVGDWVELFYGETEAVRFADDPAELQCLDMGGVLANLFITGRHAYGPVPAIPDPVPLETLLQKLIDELPIADGQIPVGIWTTLRTKFALYVPEPTGFLVTERTEFGEASLMEVLRTAALGTRGWSVKWLWHPGGIGWRLTLYDPHREKTTPDHTIPPSVYQSVTQLDVDREGIRNIIRVGLVAEGRLQTVQYPLAADVDTDPSVVKYRPRPLFVPAGEGTLVTTLADAAVLAKAIYDDLSEPAATHEIKLRPFPRARVGDLIEFPANTVHYDSPQKFAVVAVRHSLEQDETIITCRGKPAGAYRAWQRVVAHIALRDATREAPVVDVREANRTETTLTLASDANAATEEVWVRTLLLPEGHATDVKEAIRALPPEAVLSAAYAERTFDRPAPGWRLYIAYTPFSAGFAREGATELRILDAVDPEPPVLEFDSSETATSGTAWLRVQERGYTAVVEAQTQIGKEPASAWAAPQRGPGAASTVRGGTLGVGEYEQNVARVDNALSWVFVRVLLYSDGIFTGIIVAPEGMPFDRASLARIKDANVENQRAKVFCNEHTKSVSFSGPGWYAIRDGDVVSIAVPIPAADTWEIEICAYAVPAAEVTGSTPRDCVTRVVRGASVGSGDHPAVHDPIVTAPDALNDTTLTFDVAATAGSNPLSDYDWRFRSRYVRDGMEPSAWLDITSSVSPTPGVLTTGPETYTYALPSEHHFGPSSGPLLSYEIKAEAMDGSDVVDARSGWATWRIVEPL